MSAFELKEALRGTPGIESLTITPIQDGNQRITVGGQSIEVGPMASNDEIAAKLQNPFYDEKPKMTTIGEQLKAARAKLAEARDGAANAIAVSQDASRVVLGEVNKVLKEADDLRAEVAELTNGGPE